MLSSQSGNDSMAIQLWNGSLWSTISCRCRLYKHVSQHLLNFQENRDRLYVNDIYMASCWRITKNQLFIHNNEYMASDVSRIVDNRACQQIQQTLFFLAVLKSVCITIKHFQSNSRSAILRLPLQPLISLLWWRPQIPIRCINPYTHCCHCTYSIPQKRPSFLNETPPPKSVLQVAGSWLICYAPRGSIKMQL